MIDKAKNALVIGGSGMLRYVSLWLAENGYRTGVVGRDFDNLQSLKNQNSNTEAIAVDYNNDQEF